MSTRWQTNRAYLTRWVTSHRRISHVTDTNESRHTYEWVMSHRWQTKRAYLTRSARCNQVQKSHITHMHESRHKYEWTTSHIRISHVTHTNESRHTYEWVTPRTPMTSCICMSHITRTNESRHTHKWVTSRMNDTSHTYERVMQHMQLTHVARIHQSRLSCRTCLIFREDAFIIESVMSHVCMSHIARKKPVMTHMQSLSDKVGKMHSQSYQSFLMCAWVTSHIQMIHGSHAEPARQGRQDAFTTESVMSHTYVTHIWKSHVTHTNKSWLTCRASSTRSARCAQSTCRS